MNRTIKFRAWDKKEKIMLATVTGMHIAVCFENPKRFELMQFTGIKDKNGKEIYEGDILRRIHKGNYYEKNGSDYRTVKFIERKNGCGWNIGNHNSWEVWSNIYEFRNNLIKQR